MSDNLALAYERKDACARERDVALSALEETKRHLLEAQRRVDAARAAVDAYEERLERADDEVVDAELEEPGVWNAMYKKLVEWRARHGNCWVPKRKKENDPEIKKLGTWVSCQRVDYFRPKEQGKSLKNKPYQIKALERLGFSWNQYEASWDTRYEELIAYKNEFGHCNVPYNYEKNPALRQWLQVQRTQYKYLQDGKHSVITPERIKLLEDAGVVWNLMENNWHDKYRELVEYKEKHGTIVLPSPKDDESLRGLSMWVRKQQVLYRDMKAGKKTPLTEERAALLEKIGLRVGKKEKWEQRYDELAEFKQNYGHTAVPVTFAPNRALGRWAAQQREGYQQKNEGKTTKLAEKLTDDRIKRLEELGFDWGAPATTKWDLRFQQLKTFYKKNGHCNIPENFEVEPRLMSWVRSQRREYEKNMKGRPNKMTSEQIDMLTEIDFDFQYGD